MQRCFVAVSYTHLDVYKRQQVDHPVLDHLGVGGEVLERAFQQAGENGVGDVADARLQGQQVLGQPALLDLVREEVEQVRCV